MLRRLTKNDESRTLEFLSHESAMNLFMMGDIESYGMQTDFQDVWGSFNEDQELTGVLLRYHENYIPYVLNDATPLEPFISLIQSDSRAKMISGMDYILSRTTTSFLSHEWREMYFCELVDLNKSTAKEYNIKEATAADAARVYDLLVQIEEFDAVSQNSVERIAHKVQNKAGRIFYIENEQQDIISVVQTTAETQKAAMVVGVATHPDYRKCGYVTALLHHVCNILLQEDKKPCLFYDNPKAGSIYHKIGFNTIGKWVMMKLN